MGLDLSFCKEKTINSRKNATFIIMRTYNSQKNSNFAM